MPSIRTFAFLLIVLFLVGGSLSLAQSGGNSTAVTGTVVDPSGAVVPNATIEIHNPVSQYQRSTTSDDILNLIFGKFCIGK